MNINLKLSGIAEVVVEEMIAKGYAATKTEAIRMAVLDYKHHHLEEEGNVMTKEDVADLQQAIKEYKGKKTVSLEEV
ncbi:MAG: hypothetical protein V1861_00140 [Candidatus Micrarchaeota archaeon]